MPIITSLFLILTAYLLGSLSSALIVCRLLHLPDPRTQGSGNPGATNVLRIGGKVPALLTLLGDSLKGVLAVLLARALGLSAVSTDYVILAVFLGHLFPLFFQFRGGKGVATLLGALLALSPAAGIGWIIIWGLITGLSRYVSLASLIATLCTPVLLWFTTQHLAHVITFALLAMLLLYRHRLNIQQLWRGTEHKL
jgi:glycerol-3-phosphate acyltransferase PlsY